MISILIIFLAALSKAAADTIKHHPDTSIFNNTWWIKDGVTIPPSKYKVDGWHIANSITIATWLSLIFIKIPYNLAISYIILGILHILIFNLFYNKIFRLKGWKQ